MALFHYYAVKAKAAYRAIGDLTQPQAYHLSFGHEIMHAYPAGGERWSVLPSYLALGLLAAVVASFAGIKMLLLPPEFFSGPLLSYGLNPVTAFYVVIALAVAVYFLPEIAKVVTSPRGGPGGHREEVTAEIGAAQLAAATGETDGLTEYSARFIAVHLSRVRPERRLAALRTAFDMANRRYDALVELNSVAPPDRP